MLLNYQSIYVPTLTYGHELWIATERSTWKQVEEMAYDDVPLASLPRGKVDILRS